MNSTGPRPVKGQTVSRVPSGTSSCLPCTCTTLSLVLMKDVRASSLPSQERVFAAGSLEPGSDTCPEELAFRGVEEGQALARPGYRLMLFLPDLFISKQGTLSLSTLMLQDFLCLV